MILIITQKNSLRNRFHIFKSNKTLVIKEGVLSKEKRNSDWNNSFYHALSHPLFFPQADSRNIYTHTHTHEWQHMHTNIQMHTSLGTYTHKHLPTPPT